MKRSRPTRCTMASATKRSPNLEVGHLMRTVDRMARTKQFLDDGSILEMMILMIDQASNYWRVETCALYEHPWRGRDVDLLR